MNGFVFNLQLFAVYDMNGNDTLKVHSKGSAVSYGGKESINTDVHDSVKVYDESSFARGGVEGTLNKASSKTTNIAANAFVSGKVIDNYTKNTVIGGNSGADTIRNYAGGVTVRGKAGNDSIYSSQYSDYTINGSWGNVTLDGGSGNDTIRNVNSNVSINGGIGADYIYHWGEYSKIIGGDGADTIYNDDGDYSYISGGNGNDSIYAYDNDGVTVNAGNGNDKVRGSYYSSSIHGGDGRDLISITGSYYSNTINGGSGNDTITAYGGSINGGAGADRISVNSSYTTIKGGTGNDTIYGNNSSVLYQYSSGDGKDKIIGFNANSTLKIGNGTTDTYSKIKSGNNILVSVGSGVITLSGAASLSAINIQGTEVNNNNKVTLTPYNDTYTNTVERATIAALGGSDKLNNTAANVSINAGTGSDSIKNSGYYSKILGGDGADTIYNYDGDYSYISGGNGNDSIYAYDNDGVTVNAGNGNDKVRGSYYSSSIHGGDGRDLISITGSYYSNTINGGSGNDTITAYGGSINGGAGADRISVNSSYTTIKGGTGNDTIYGKNSGVLYQYSSGDGKDKIIGFNTNSTLQIGGGTGTYSSQKSGSDVIVTVGTGKITLSGAASLSAINIQGTEVDKRKVTLTPYNDTYTNTVSGATIAALDGNDIIDNTVANVSINADTGDDSIKTSGYYSTLIGGAGNDSVVLNRAHYSEIYGGEGADHISLDHSDYDSIYAGSGDDTVIGIMGLTYIDGGTGNDFVSIGGDTLGGAHTIRGGAGDDTIYGNSHTNLNGGIGQLFVYESGDGYDVIANYDSYDTISIGGSAQYRTLTSGSNVVISLEGGAMTLNGASGKSINIVGGSQVVGGVTINNYDNSQNLIGTSYADSVYNSGYYVEINTGNAQDTVYNDDGNYSYISTSEGDDSIKNYDGDDVTIDAGADDDYIINDWSYRVSVNAGAGNDVIELISGQKGVTVKGGTGDDTIYGSNNSSDGVLYQYSSGDGSDVIYNWSSNDSLTIAGGNSLSSMVSGNDVLINIEGSGTITLGGAKDKTINVYPAITPAPGSDVSPQEVIKKFMGSLDTTDNSGVSALNEAVYAASGGYFSDIQSAIDSMVADCRNASSANDFLLNYCGIDLSNNDTGAITGYDAGGSTTKNAEDIVPESGSLHDFDGTSFETDYGLTVKLGSIPYDGTYVYTPSDLSFDSLNAEQRYIWRAFETWWANATLKLITESYGSNYGFSSSSATRTMYFGFFEEEPDADGSATLAWTAMPGGVLAMAPNMHSEVYGRVQIGSSDGDAGGWGYLDRTLAHEMTHAVMKANIYGYGNLPQFITEGTAELTQGSDDDREWSINYLANHPDNLEASLNLDDHGTGQIGVIDAYAGGFMFMRYLAKQASEHYGTSNSMAANKYSINGLNNNATISGSLLTLAKSFAGKTVDLTKYPDKVRNLDATALDTGLTVFGNANANSIATGSGDDKVFANTGNDKIFGGAGNDILHGDAGNDSVNGGAGADTINGGTGDDTLTGGKGNDLFIFGDMSGKDVITDYVAGKDSIKFTAEHTKIISASLSGNDVVLTLDLQSSITLRDAKDKEITVIDYTGKSTSSVYGGAGSDSLWGSKNAGAFVYSSDDNLIYGSDDTTPTLDDLAITSSNKEDANALTFDNNSTAFKDYTATTSHIYDDTQQLNNSTHAKK